MATAPGHGRAVSAAPFSARSCRHLSAPRSGKIGGGLWGELAWGAGAAAVTNFWEVYVPPFRTSGWCKNGWAELGRNRRLRGRSFGTRKSMISGGTGPFPVSRKFLLRCSRGSDFTAPFPIFFCRAESRPTTAMLRRCGCSLLPPGPSSSGSSPQSSWRRQLIFAAFIARWGECQQACRCAGPASSLAEVIERVERPEKFQGRRKALLK